MSHRKSYKLPLAQKQKHKKSDAWTHWWYKKHCARKWAKKADKNLQRLRMIFFSQGLFSAAKDLNLLGRPLVPWRERQTAGAEGDLRRKEGFWLYGLSLSLLPAVSLFCVAQSSACMPSYCILVYFYSAFLLICWCSRLLCCVVEEWFLSCYFVLPEGMCRGVERLIWLMWVCLSFSLAQIVVWTVRVVQSGLMFEATFITTRKSKTQEACSKQRIRADSEVKNPMFETLHVSFQVSLLKLSFSNPFDLISTNETTGSSAGWEAPRTIPWAGTAVAFAATVHETFINRRSQLKRRELFGAKADVWGAFVWVPLAYIDVSFLF